MPTIQNISGPYRFFFYSFDCNEPPHIHVQRERMTCKFWIEPITLSMSNGFSDRELRQIRRMVSEYQKRFLLEWRKHCGQ